MGASKGPQAPPTLGSAPAQLWGASSARVAAAHVPQEAREQHALIEEDPEQETEDDERAARQESGQDEEADDGGALERRLGARDPLPPFLGPERDAGGEHAHRDGPAPKDHEHSRDDTCEAIVHGCAGFRLTRWDPAGVLASGGNRVNDEPDQDPPPWSSTRASRTRPVPPSRVRGRSEMPGRLENAP